MKKIKGPVQSFETAFYCILTSFISAVFFAAILSGYHALNALKFGISNKISLVAFASSDLNYEVVVEKLQNTDGIIGLDFVSSKAVLQQVAVQAPHLTGFISADQNPFSPHFFVKTSEISAAAFNALKLKLLNIKGIDEVRYDEKALKLYDSYNALLRALLTFFAFMAVMIAAIIAGKLIYRIFQKNVLFDNYLMTGVYGIIAGISALLVFIIFKFSFSFFTLSPLYVKDCVLIVISGIAFYMVADN